MQTAGYEVLSHRTDVSKAEDIQALADAAVARFGAVHLLCNNAGVRRLPALRDDRRRDVGLDNRREPLGGDSRLPDFPAILDKQDEAHIVNTASVAGIYAYTYLHPYNVAKSGVVALSEGMWREFATDKPHVGISVLLPASVDTAIVNDERNARPGTHAGPRPIRPWKNSARCMLPGSQPAKAAEVADIVLSGIRDRQLHIFTHPETRVLASQRGEDIAADAPLRDMFGVRPQSAG